MINLVIPMAGAGSRYKIAGYNSPKPFIKFHGKMMIEHVLSSFNELETSIILVLQEAFLKNQEKELNYLSSKYSLEYVTVPKLTMGAAITALSAHKKINPEYDILFADSDNIFNKNDINNFVKNARMLNLDGSLLTFTSNLPCYSYVKLGLNNKFEYTKEKEVISTNAICGVYYFKELEQFRDSVIDLIVESDLSCGEFYMSNVYNHLKKYTDKIGIFNINEFVCVGTPEQLKDYLSKNGVDNAKV